MQARVRLEKVPDNASRILETFIKLNAQAIMNLTKVQGFSNGSGTCSGSSFPASIFSLAPIKTLNHGSLPPMVTTTRLGCSMIHHHQLHLLPCLESQEENLWSTRQACHLAFPTSQERNAQMTSSKRQYTSAPPKNPSVKQSGRHLWFWNVGDTLITLPFTTTVTTSSASAPTVVTLEFRPTSRRRSRTKRHTQQSVAGW